MALPDKKRSMIRTVTLPIEPGRNVNVYWYGTKDAAAATLAAGYFNFGREYLKHEDIIHVVAGVDDAVELLRVKVNAVPATGDVTVINLDESAGG